MQFLKKPFAWAIFYGTILTLFATFVILDTFVIVKAYEKVNPDISQSSPTPEPEEIELISTDTEYRDTNIHITLTEYRENNTTIYVADVVLSSPEYLKTAFANGTYGRNVKATTSQMAAQNNAILAINGDYYGARNNGFVIRQGVLYRSNKNENNQQALCIWADGSFSIAIESKVTAQSLLNQGVVQVLSFGPGLVEDGQITVGVRDEVDKAMANNPRTAIVWYDDLHYALVVSDGRTRESTGLTLYQLATFLQELGAKYAYNLDGGGSSTMVFNGRLVNKPTTDGKRVSERSVSDIVYIGY